MKLKHLKKTFNKRIKLLRRYFFEKDLLDNLEQIHQFRIAYKRVRAVIRLMALEQIKAKNLLKKVKNLYLLLGNIRSFQILYQSIENYYKHTGLESREYLIKLSKRIFKVKRRYSVLEKQISFNKLYIDLEKYTPVKLHNKPIRNYINTQIEALNENIDHPTDEGIHLIRKILKDFQYTSKLLLSIKGDETSILEDVQKLKEVTDFIGNYNDLRINRMHLSSLSYKVPLEEQRILKQLKKEWLEKKKLQKEKVLNSIKVLVSNNALR